MIHYVIFALAFLLWTFVNLYLRRVNRLKIIQKELKIFNLKRLKNKIKTDRIQIQNAMVPKKATIKNLKLLVIGVILLWSCLTFYDLYKDFSWKESIEQFRWVMLNIKINLSTGVNT